MFHDPARDRKATDAQRRPPLHSTPIRQAGRPGRSGASALKQRVGNQAIQRLMGEVAAPSQTAALRPPAIQTKLTLSQPGDAQEREADRVADAVMRMPSEDLQTMPVVSPAAPASSVQRLCADCEEEEKNKAGTPVHRKEQTAATPPVTPSVASNIQAMCGGGSALPDATRAFFEPRFGVNFSSVRVHTGTRAEQAAEAISAKAFTVGNNIAFGRGQYSPSSHKGRKLLAHELAHTVQQGACAGDSDRSVQRDLLDDLTEGLTGAGESLITEAASAVSTVSSEAGSVVEGTVDAVTSAVSTGAQTVGEVVESAQQQLGAVSAAAAPVHQPGEIPQSSQIDWNSSPALTLKAWALKSHPQLFRDARGKSPAAIFSQIDFPPHILEAAAELARQSRAVVPSPVSTPSPVSGPASGPVSTGPVSRVRPVVRPAPGIGLAGTGVIVIGFIIGFVLPFLIGYVLEHSEELSEEPDPDVISPPGGAGPVSDTSAEAGAPAPSSKPTRAPAPDLDPERDPREERCRELFRESPTNPTHANPLECDQVSLESVLEFNLEKPIFMLENPKRYRFGKPRISQGVEDADACGQGRGRTFHIPIIDNRTNSPVKGREVSVFECVCCDEEGNLGVVFERPHVSSGRK